MKGYSRTRRYAPLTHGIKGLLIIALVCAAALFGCKGKDTTNVTNVISEPTSTLGVLNVNVTPASASVTVTGPTGFTAQTFDGAKLLTALTPGQYTAAATLSGYGNATSSINVVAGHTSSISLTLQATSIVPPTVTVGSLNVNVTPAAASVTVTGPLGYTQTFIGNEFLTNLTPGEYTAKATAAGYTVASNSINVVVGQTSSLSIAMQATPVVSTAPRVVYRDGQGNLIPLDSSKVQSGKFVFYAWLQDLPSGILTTHLTTSTESDPFSPLVTEQTEFAPSFTQNLAGAWVGYTDSTGVVRPVIGADVRWEIDQQWLGRVNSTQFGTSDDNGIGTGLGIFDDQSNTRTNNARLDNERFPLIATQYPLYDATGILTPYIDGFTWVTLFSPDAKASSRIVAVATINGEEIGKQILYKNFAPAPSILISKSVDTNLINLDNTGGVGTVTWTVTVTNVGAGDATNVNLNDFQTAGTTTTYTPTIPGGTSANGNNGFTDSFPLVSPFTVATPPPVADQTAQLLGNAESFAVLAYSSVTNNGSSVVSGNVGISPLTSITGFPPGLVLNGTIHIADAPALAAQTALTAAYDDLAGRACTKPLNTAITGILAPGVYCYDSSVTTGTDVTLDAGGDPAAEFVFKIASTLGTPAGATFKLINGASPCNVYWQVGSSATLGANNFFVGNILAQASITAGNGTSISGRALARTAAVTLDTNAITAPLACVTAPIVVPLSSTQTYTFTANVTAPGTYCNEALINSYTGDTTTVTPLDLSAQACFTAVQSNVSIVKDFVAADNTTSLGKSRTVAANVPARLRVRVINDSTSGSATISIHDTLNGGASSAYTLSGLSSGTTNSVDGFDTANYVLTAGSTTTVLFNVVASADGTYCDTATVSSTGTIGIGSDSACLTVATPNLTITKTDAPTSVLPGATYTSTIGVHNGGTAAANNVVISDLLGQNASTGAYVIYVSSSQNGVAGTLAASTVTANSISLASGGTATFTVVSRIPAGASGSFCDTGTVTSSNAATKQATACVNVPSYVALQTQLVDLNDPVQVGSSVTYASVLYVEALSNEGASNTKLTYSFGMSSPTVLGVAGLFQVTNTQIYLDTAPVRDPVTGLVVSDPSNASATLLTNGTDYTLDNTTPGLQKITMATGVILQPNTALYVRHVCLVPSGTPINHLYTTSYIWDSVGLTSGTAYEASSSEPTTVTQ